MIEKKRTQNVLYVTRKAIYQTVLYIYIYKEAFN